MRRMWSVLMASAIVVAIVATAASSSVLGSQQPVSTPSISDLATRVAALETRVATLESKRSPEVTGKGEATFKLEAHDPYDWSTKKFTIEAGGTVTVTNTGVLPHDFSVDALKIAQPLDPGKTVEVKIPDDAKPGDYEFYCNVPGHKAAGMFGTMTVVAKGSAAAPPAGGGQADGVASPTSSPDVPGATSSITVEMGDLYFKPKEFSIPANTEVTITLKNVGALPHDFNIDSLNVHSPVVQPGKTATVTIKGAAGSYQYYCNQPGHKAAGMVGTLTVSDEGKSPLRNVRLGSVASAAATAPATPQTIDVPPFQVTIADVNRADTVGTVVTSKARGVYMVVNVHVLNISNAPTSTTNTDLFKATLRDSQGRTFSLDITASIYASPDITTDFQPGLSYDVALVFDVPPDASGFTLVVGGQEVPLPTTPGT